MSEDRARPFVYDALTTPKSFRLLKILKLTPKNSCARLVCSLHAFDLAGGCPDYFALSYTWGAPFDTAWYHDAYSLEYNVRIRFVDTAQAERRKRKRGGDLKSTGKLSLGQLEIGRNLYEALQRIYETDDEAYIWADAICINQNNKEDCNQQVNLMGDIYSRAKAVVVWLGNPGDHIEHLSLFFDGPFAERFEEYLELSDVQSLEVLSEPGVNVKVLGFEFSEDAIRSLAWFYHHLRWIRRCWTLQEPTLSVGEVVACGDLTLHVQQLSDVSQLVSQHVEFNLAAASKHKDEEAQILLNRASWMNNLKMVSLVHATGGADSEAMSLIFQDYFGARDRAARRVAYLEWLIGETAYRQSHDPRDRVYSLLGFVDPRSEEAPLLRPNYYKSVRDVYLEVAQVSVTSLPHLTILSLAHHYQEDGRSNVVEGLPSWVPNFTNNSYHETLWLQNMRCGRYPAFKAVGRCDAKDSAAQVRGSQLRLRARYCGTIVKRWISEIRPETETRERNDLYTSKLLEALLQLGCEELGFYDDGTLGESKMDAVVDLITWASGAGKATQDRAKEGLVQRLKSWARAQLSLISLTADAGLDNTLHEQVKAWVTLKLGGIYAVNLESIEYRALYHSMWEAYELIEEATWLPTRSEIDNAVSLADESSESACPISSAHIQTIVDRQRQCLMVVSQTIAHRGLFLTSNGLIGQCQVGAQSGDEIWLLQDAHVPFTLRRTKRRGHFSLVGECYIQGGMHGQLIDNKIAGELDSITLI